MPQSPHDARRRGPGRPRAEHAGDSRTLLLTVARQQFAAQGYTATTTRGISQAAGMQAANLRHHLGSKPAVFAAVYEDCLARIGLLLAEMVELDGPPTPGGYLRRLGRLVVDAPDVMAFLAIAPVERSRHPELQQPIGSGPAGLEELVRATVATWVAQGRVAEGVDATSLADVLIAVTYGTLLYGSLIDRRVDLPEAVTTLARLVDGTVWSDLPAEG